MLSLVDEGHHETEFFDEARAAGKVVDRPAPVSRISGRGVFIRRTVAGAPVSKRNVNPAFTVDVKVVEIQQVSV